jgi:hypothetical protein
MTEAEWLACDDPKKMLTGLRRQCPERKLRLFAVACGRAIQPEFPDLRSRVAIDVAERYADGGATK